MVAGCGVRGAGFKSMFANSEPRTAKAVLKMRKREAGALGWSPFHFEETGGGGGGEGGAAAHLRARPST